MGSRRLARRRAASPVVATMVLIVVTLIAAAAVAGFVFGMMVTFTNVALVSAGSPTCKGTPEVCAIVLENSGSGGVGIEGTCALRIGGSSTPGVAVIESGDLSGGSNAVVDCTTTQPLHAQPGSAVTGWVDLENGARVFFYGTAA